SLISMGRDGSVEAIQARRRGVSCRVRSRMSLRRWAWMVSTPRRAVLVSWATLTARAIPLLQLRDARRAARAAEALAGVPSGLPIETDYAACFMARYAKADDEDHSRRIALALEYLERAVEKGFNDFDRFQQDRKQYFVTLE